MKKTWGCLMIFLLLLGLVSCQDAYPTEKTTDNRESVTTQEVSDTGEINDNSCIEIAKNRALTYAVIRSDTADEVSLKLAVGLYNDLLKACSAYDGRLATDWLKRGEQYDAESYEILVGDTAYPETKEFKSKLKWNECGYSVIGHKIVIAAHSYDGLKSAIKSFTALVKNGAMDGESSVYVDLSEPMIKKVPTYPSDFPDYSGGELLGAFDLDDGEYEFIVENTSNDEFNAYIEKVKAAGFTEQTRSCFGEDNVFVHLTDAVNKSVYAHYSKLAEKTFVVVGKNNITEINVKGDGDICDVQLTMPDISVTNTNEVGMVFIVRLADSSFLVIDGGKDLEEKNSGDIYRIMKKQNVRPDGKLIIRAWILTHAHVDHYGGMRTFAGRYSGEVTCERLIFADLASGIKANSDTTTGWDAIMGMLVYPNIEVIKPHAGQVFQFPGLTIETLFSSMDCFVNPYWIQYLNDSSAVYKFNMPGNVNALITGDIMENSAIILCDLYGDYLRSDIVQIAHHGYYGACDRFYDTVGAEVMLWPVTYEVSVLWGEFPVNKYWMNLPTTREVIVPDGEERILKMPYTSR